MKLIKLMLDMIVWAVAGSEKTGVSGNDVCRSRDYSMGLKVHDSDGVILTVYLRIFLK